MLAQTTAKLAFVTTSAEDKGNHHKLLDEQHESTLATGVGNGTKVARKPRNSVVKGVHSARRKNYFKKKISTSFRKRRAEAKLFMRKISHDFNRHVTKLKDDFQRITNDSIFAKKMRSCITGNNRSSSRRRIYQNNFECRRNNDSTCSSFSVANSKSLHVAVAVCTAAFLNLGSGMVVAALKTGAGAVVSNAVVDGLKKKENEKERDGLNNERERNWSRTCSNSSGNSPMDEAMKDARRYYSKGKCKKKIE